MTEEEKEQIKVLLKYCRKQCRTYDKEKQDREELVKMKEEENINKKCLRKLRDHLVNNSLRLEGQGKRWPF